MANDYLFGSNAVFIEELYDQFKTNPNSVDASWRELFQAATGGNSEPSWVTHKNKIIGVADPEALPVKKPANQNIEPDSAQNASVDSIRALMLIRAYRERGHTNANLDPLGLAVKAPGPELDPAYYGFTGADYAREIYLNGQLGLEKATLSEILRILLKTYCNGIGFEYEHITHPEQRAFLRERIESSQSTIELSPEKKDWLLETLTEVEGFEQFIHVKFTGTKRFSVEGGDVAIPSMKYIIETSANLGVDEVVIGMPHRGRLNILTAVMRKPYAAMLSEFYGNLSMPEGIGSSGDVKYHMGYSQDIEVNGKKVHLSLTANPSHLEAVNSVVTGKVRAKQDQKNDTERSRVTSIVLHGDAAFAGQGSVAENFVLSDLDGYRTGGTVHIIVNNQIGFTTDPKKGRSSPYLSDVAKMVGAPIFHVNGDDAESVMFVSNLPQNSVRSLRRMWCLISSATAATDIMKATSRCSPSL